MTPTMFLWRDGITVYDEPRSIKETERSIDVFPRSGQPRGSELSKHLRDRMIETGNAPFVFDRIPAFMIVGDDLCQVFKERDNPSPGNPYSCVPNCNSGLIFEKKWPSWWKGWKKA